MTRFTHFIEARFFGYDQMWSLYHEVTDGLTAFLRAHDLPSPAFVPWLVPQDSPEEDELLSIEALDMELSHDEDGWIAKLYVVTEGLLPYASKAFFVELFDEDVVFSFQLWCSAKDDGVEEHQLSLWNHPFGEK